MCARSISRWLSAALAFGFVGMACDDDDGKKVEAQTCPDFCGAGSTCVDNVCVSVPCDPACGQGEACILGECVRVDCDPACEAGFGCVNGRCAPLRVDCTPACGAGEACVDGACVVLYQDCDPACGEGEACVDGACVVLYEACDPACGGGEACVDGACVVLYEACDPACGDGEACVDGACVRLYETCVPACGPCEVCDTAASAPICVALCGEGEACVDGVCALDNVHAAYMRGPYDSGPQVTAECLKCHAAAADHLLASAHFKWTGPTPGLVGHESAVTFGKKNLINNFCIAIASNEKRCTQCHAAYGSDPVKDNGGVVIAGGPAYRFPEAGKADCLVCHADLTSSKYVKAVANWGAAAVAGIPDPAADPDYGVKLRQTLLSAAQSVGAPKRDNCGSCHFGAGGGENVKMGDLASSLKSPTPEVDVHMGSTMTCVSCHSTTTHQPPGTGVSVAVQEAPLDCVGSCHDAAPHSGGLGAILNNHALDVSCQSCHVPAFSRQIPTKMLWDWSTAGDKQACQGYTPCVNGVAKTTVGGREVEVYNWMKGTFRWELNVRPVYAWYDGRAAHMAVNDTFDPSRGLSAEAPLRINGPVASKADAAAKIFPFKHMRGRQAAMADGRFVITPHLFGVDGFWGKRPDGTAVVPAQYDAGTLVAIWSEIFTFGAKAAGQLAKDAPALTASDWRWVETEMFMNINHEVAPKAAALTCTGCHNNSAFDFVGLGYSCDPMGGVNCGSRH